MLVYFIEHPGLWFVAATLLPMVSVVILMLMGFVRNALRRSKDSDGFDGALFHLLGGEVSGPVPAYIATAAIGLAFVCSLVGFVIFLRDDHHGSHHAEGAHKEHVEKEPAKKDHHQDEPGHDHKKDHKEPAGKPAEKEKEKAALDGDGNVQLVAYQDKHAEPKEEKKKEEHQEPEKNDEHHEKGPRWKGSMLWATVVTPKPHKPGEEVEEKPASTLKLGYYIDHLSAIMFVMVTFIATLIHLFSIGYMHDELKKSVEDHEVHTEHGHFHRRGRFGRFFLFLSLFCFSMLNLILADNLFQVFLSWELVGVCSYLLVGFYYERTSAANAANKAFITNRVGDAGFIIGLLVIWTYVGTLNFQEVFERLRAPGTHNEQPVALGFQIVRGNLVEPMAKNGDVKLKIAKEGESGEFAVLFPRPPHSEHATFEGAGSVINATRNPDEDDYSYVPNWMLIVAGLGIFLGCVGKSAQFPLHVWLPDAMEGPTPVSALIHAATMVAAGVYLVGRCFPLFTFEVQLTIAYVGAITLFVAATVAVVMTDIKKVLAYSTVSQLGYMMLALGVGGWAAGLFHLITHAFFKALLFLGSGSVIYGCHHQQDMMKMGGLFPKMKITALTMLMGVLAICGIPFFSGWYSKDAVLAHAFGFHLVYKDHFLLFYTPLITAGLTTFYMFRMWLMTFTGTPRDHHVYEHAHESPWVMTVPLIALAFFSVTVGWGWPVWDPEASWLEHQLHHSQPDSVIGDYGGFLEEDGIPTGPPYKQKEQNIRYQAHIGHGDVGNLALGTVIIGFIFAYLIYYRRAMNPGDAADQFPGVYGFLQHKWYFDELYSACVVRPGLVIAGWARWFDTNVIDGLLHAVAKITLLVSFVSGLNDRDVVDGSANLIADVCQGIGNGLRRVQTGYIRSYVLFLALAALAGLWLLSNVFAAAGAR